MAFEPKIENGCLVIRIPVRVEAEEVDGKKLNRKIVEERLTRRETEVFGAIRRGLANKEIAAEMHISISSVKAHAGRIFQKLGVHSRAELFREFGFDLD